MVQRDHHENQPAARDQPPRCRGRYKALVKARELFEGSLAQRFVMELKALDFSSQIMLFGAGMLLSLLPFLILLSAFASRRVDEDIALYLGLDRPAAEIVTHLLTSSPTSLDVATATSLVFVTFGTLAIASSLQQVYEKIFRQNHQGIRGVYRLPIWLAALCAAMTAEGAVARPARNLAGGVGLAQVVTFAILAPFFWWTMHFLLAGRVSWRRLLPSAIATGLFFAGLGIFSKFYFSATIINDSRTFGSIGAIFGILTWFVAIAAVVILGAVAGALWKGQSASRLPGTTRLARPRARTLAVPPLAHRCGQLELHAVRVLEGEHVDLERRQAGDVAVGYARIVQQLHRAVEVGPALHAEAEMVQADPVGVEAVAGRRHRP
jgi:membrane protein